MSSNLQRSSTDDATIPLTPFTLSEAEAALACNEALQTSSAGRPQPATPQHLPSTNYVCAALHQGANPGTPHPPSFRPQESTDSGAWVGHEHDAGVPPLSRGTTRVVLEKMASPEFGSELMKRMSREGERRTSLIPVRSGESEGDPADGSGHDGEKGVKPGFNRQQSWSQEDVKRVMMERLMEPVDEGGGGYSSA